MSSAATVLALDLNQAQYCIIPDQDGGAVDDAYLYRFEENRFLLVVNAANTDKDLAHLNKILPDYNCSITNITGDVAAIAVQGPKSKELSPRSPAALPSPSPMKNALNTLTFEGRTVPGVQDRLHRRALGYEVYIESGEAAWLWNRLVELGAKPAGLGARDTLRLEAGFPLYGHELGTAPDGSTIPIFAIPMARFAVSFSDQKGDYIGRRHLEVQSDAFQRIMNRDFSDMATLPKRIQPIALVGRGVMRAGMPIYRNDEVIGWVTSGTMVPYYRHEGLGLATKILDTTAKRAIGLAYLASDVLEDDLVEVDTAASGFRPSIPPYHMRVDAPPFARPIIYKGG